LKAAVAGIAADRQRWIDFMMRFELGLERPDPKRAPISAVTIGGSYIVGGLVPLVPYMLAPDITTALRISVVATGVALLCFGAIKGHFTGVNKIKAALQTPCWSAAWRLRRRFGSRICSGEMTASAGAIC
jgi:VIT1/CCC1 family predicted Fe2+/Mn2+ transporter